MHLKYWLNVVTIVLVFERDKFWCTIFHNYCCCYLRAVLIQNYFGLEPVFLFRSLPLVWIFYFGSLWHTIYNLRSKYSSVCETSWTCCGRTKEVRIMSLTARFDRKIFVTVRILLIFIMTTTTHTLLRKLIMRNVEMKAIKAASLSDTLIVSIKEIRVFFPAEFLLRYITVCHSIN